MFIYGHRMRPCDLESDLNVKCYFFYPSISHAHLVLEKFVFSIVWYIILYFKPIWNKAIMCPFYIVYVYLKWYRLIENEQQWPTNQEFLNIIMSIFYASSACNCLYASKFHWWNSYYSTFVRFTNDKYIRYILAINIYIVIAFVSLALADAIPFINV